MATPRQPKGPPSKGDARGDRTFANDKEVFEYLGSRGRTQAQIARLVTGAALGAAVAKVFQVLPEHGWLWGAHGPATKGVPAALHGWTLLVKEPLKETPPALIPAVRFANAGVRALSATRKLVRFARTLKATIDETDGLKTSLKHWKSQQQMMAAFTLLVAEAEKLTLGYKEMEAIALIAGVRTQQFAHDEKTTLQRAENWRRSMEKARKHIVPVLRKMSETAA